MGIHCIYMYMYMLLFVDDVWRHPPILWACGAYVPVMCVHVCVCVMVCVCCGERGDGFLNWYLKHTQ